MPEASMHENGGAVFRKQEIRPPPDTRGMKPVAKSTGMKGPPEEKLRFRVLPFYARHHAGPGLFVYNVCHGHLVSLAEPGIHEPKEA